MLNSRQLERRYTSFLPVAVLHSILLLLYNAALTLQCRCAGDEL
jgi:hypothetical protein